MRRLALLCAALALAALAVGVTAGTPSAQTTSPEACRPGGGPIPAAALPETLDLANCPIGGRVITDKGVGTVLPPPGRGVYVESLTTEGSQELEVTRYRDGTVELDHVGEETDDAQTSSDVVAEARSSECSDRAYNDEGRRVTAALGYLINLPTTPPELTRDAAQGAINTGGTNITGTRNKCGLEDGVTAELRYLGDTNATADISATCADVDDSDDNNVVSFGDRPAGILATTCVWFVPNPSGDDEVTESDIEINKVDFKWTTNPRKCRNKYDLQSVMTHEWGHTFGLGHVGEKRHGKLTMSPLIRSCQKSERTLGKGDVRGLNSKYP